MNHDMRSLPRWTDFTWNNSKKSGRLQNQQRRTFGVPAQSALREDFVSPMRVAMQATPAHFYFESMRRRD